MPDNITVPQSRFGIRKIRIWDLFGEFTYDLRLSDAGSTVASRVLILYGDNGSGKTTLLQLIFNLLSHLDKKGHKWAVASTKFKRLEIDIGDAIQVGAEKIREDLKGGFTAWIKNGGETLISVSFQTNEDCSTFIKGPEIDQAQNQFLRELENLHLGLFFLADDRKIKSNVLIEEAGDDQRSQEARRRWELERTFRIERDPNEAEDLDSVLEAALTRLTIWLTQQAFRGSTQGEEDVNTIYGDIAKRLSKYSSGRDEDSISSKELINMIEEQYARSQSFARYGLIKPLKIEELTSSLQLAHQSRREILVGVLKPYITGMKAKLDALEAIKSAVASFVESINAFYHRKTVEFDMRKGERAISILSSKRESLPTKILSSGEKQLLLLFCNTAMASSNPAIFIIDEPEISLNVKWQRQLVNSLLSMTRHSQIQFVLASHSIELISRHKKNVLKLDNIATPVTK